MSKKPKETQACVKLFKDGLLYKQISQKLYDEYKKANITIRKLSMISGVNQGTIKYLWSSKDTGRAFSVLTFFGVAKALQIDFNKLLPVHGNSLEDLPPPLEPEKISELFTASKGLNQSKEDLLSLIKTLTRMARTVNSDIDKTKNFLLKSAETGDLLPHRADEILLIVGRRIRNVRIIRGMERTHLTAKSGIPLASVFAIESGLQNLSLENLYKITTSLNIPPTFLFNSDEKTQLLEKQLEQRTAAIISGDYINTVSDMISVIDHLGRSSRL